MRWQITQLSERTPNKSQQPLGAHAQSRRKAASCRSEELQMCRKLAAMGGEGWMLRLHNRGKAGVGRVVWGAHTLTHTHRVRNKQRRKSEKK
eukprot:c30505_g1_i1 orf=31-306(+)